MKFNELSDMMQKPEPKPDTYEAGMALNQLLKIGTHAIKIHNMIDDAAEMEAWVAKKIDLASNYVKSVHGYTAGSKAGTYDDDGMSEMKKMPKGTGTMQGVKEDAGEKIANMAQNMSKDQFMSHADELGLSPEEAAEYYEKMQGGAHAGKFEDAGEGHMSKSQLYQTAKMSIELLDMIKKGDDLEGWVQTKLNLAADYLQAVYHYEDYQKLNPYREELDGSLIQRHAGIIQKHLDEILERKCRAEDVDTKPGMMRILKKRVNEVEKEIAKENRKESQETSEAIELEEGIKEWGKRLAMAGVIVAGLAGVNSINNAIDNSVPAIKAMNTALELAQDSGNTELAKMIEKDLSDAKVRLSSGKDLSQVADMQDKYAKFMKTEGMAYESKLAVNLKQRLK
jgi:hypothetical protein